MALNDYALKYLIDADTRQAVEGMENLDGVLGKLTGAAGFGGFGGPAGIAAAGLASITAAATATGIALFNLSKQAAEFGSTIFDASEKTGLGAETLSSLKFAAEQSGSSMEAVVKATAKFAKTVGDAADGSKEAALDIQQLGITPQEALNDLDGSLGKVFRRILDAKSGTEQMILAQKAFGRSGAELLPTLKSFDGDLGALIKSSRELGVTITDEAARQADEFGDTLDSLSAQLAGVGRTIGFAVMPQLTDLAKEFSDFLKSNKNDVDWWAEAIGTGFSNAINWVKLLSQTVSDHKTEFRVLAAVASGGLSEAGLALWDRFSSQVDKSVADRNAGYVDLSLLTPEERQALSPKLKNSGSYANDLLGGAGNKAKNILPAFGSMKTLVISSGNPQWDSWFAQMGAKFKVDPNVLLLQALGESSFNKNAVSPKGAQGFSQFMPGTAKRFGVDTSSIKDSIRGQAEYMAVLLSQFGGDYRKALAGYNAGEGAVQKYNGIPPFAETRKYVSKIQSSYNRRVRKDGGGFGTYDYDADEAARIKELNEAYQRLLAIGDATNDFFASQADIEKMAAIAAGDYTTAIQKATEASDLRLQTLRDDVEETQRRLDAATDENEKIKLRHDLDIKTIDLQKAQAEEAANLGREINDLTERMVMQDIAAGKLIEHYEQINDLLKTMPTGFTDLTGMQGLPNLAPGKDGVGTDRDEVGKGPFDPWTESWLQFIDALNANYGTAQSTISGIGKELEGTVNGVTGAVGSSIESWLLYGDSIGVALQKALAAELAHLAGTATIHALEATALGFFRLAQHDYPAAGAAFTSAAMWAGVAVAAGVGAKIASPGSSQSANGGSSSGGSSYQSQQSQTPDPYSRQTQYAYQSGSNQPYRELAQAISRLEEKLDTARPGDVLVRGMQQRPGAVGAQVVNDIKRNGGKQMAIHLGMK